ncbi:hypothetical protein AGABI2DRAFT_203499 [Agaricus bisporus var. bisporus H97]|uniref:hypothetical protein n=1 Tax=Agaricus bisporus var. bisporus (strain H97 / ATCC MYA-4626 / FGSC 10389) TaxID=936046 RepID=UPI00029F5AA4|nr:hypothetical protein AGABI2DRAFT_203499 [Agaricus bisporus var. bisporus H97]EKV48582.1 hypothetical protein AGABI2DRAFT_203499 [Agaricus bisporus var. bisporus H97]
MASSKQFMDIYRKLPPEAQRALVEKQLAPLLDTTSSKKRDRAIKAVKRSRSRYEGIPGVNLKKKKREMQTLILMLVKDEKIGFTRERSNREEILQEAVLSISGWVSQIWTMVYEYRVNFELAHECLIYALKSVSMLEESPAVGDCKCLFHNIYFTVPLKDKKKRTIKYFSFTGPRNLDNVCLWIWRDLFLCMLAEDSRSQNSVQKMLIDIEECLGWQGVEHVLYGGKRKSPSDDDNDEEYYDEDEGEEHSDEEETLREYEDVGTDDEYYYDSDGEDRCCCPFHAKYWSENLNQERTTLEKIVKSYLMDIFREAPDADLFFVINSIGRPSPRIVKELMRALNEGAGASVESFRAALTIHTNLYHPEKILNLLDAHYAQLRPNDCPTLLGAIAVLNSSYRPQALRFVEAELMDVVKHIHVAIRSEFSHFAEDPNKADLAEIVRLPAGPARVSRIERWVDRSITSPSSETFGPMAFAAMMMGFPVGSSSSSIDETEFLAYSDLIKPDPDLEDLREEFRPQLKPRFETWKLYAQNMPGNGNQILHRVYAKIIELMPFFQASDVVTMMTNRISDRPNKSHVSEVIPLVSDFCKTHRKKFMKVRNARRKNGVNINSADPTSQTHINAATAGSASASTSNPPPPPPGTVFHIFGGGHMHTVGPVGAVPNTGGSHSSSAPNVNSAPGGGGGTAHNTQMPECNHQ